MIFMMKQIEKEEQIIYNVFPMRSEVIPKHIRLDTTTLVHLLMTKKQGNKSDFLTKGNFKRIFGTEKDVIVCFSDYKQKKTNEI